jgi:hypothetical protein
MRVHNVHERELPASPGEVGALLDGLEQWWPSDRWPALRPDRPLGVGARSKRGPIREEVVDYEPGRRIDFELKAPRGLVARHRFEVEPEAAERAVLRHTIDGRLEGWARLSWPLAIRPLHDALIEDLLDRAEAEVTGAPGPARSWTRRVRVLRWAFGKARRA